MRGCHKTDKTSTFAKFGSIHSHPNQTQNLGSVEYAVDSAAGRYYKVQSGSKIEFTPSVVLNIKPKNAEQVCAVDALLDHKVELVVLNGCAGTGKTLLALACGITQVLKGLYRQTIVIRPVIAIPGTDIGYLPGDVKEKLAPWTQPIYDNLAVLNIPKQFISSSKKKNKKEKPDQSSGFDTEDLIQIEALTYIRGRSLPDRYIIVDEAQNLRPIDIKTIVTRAGEGTKIVFTGDLEQIDTPYLDAESSGLAYLIDRFINQENFCYIHMKDTVRSRLAEQGAKLL